VSESAVSQGAVDEDAVEFFEESAQDRTASLPLSHLSLELGHLYMEDFAAGPARLRELFGQVAPWARAAREQCAQEVAGRARISTCFLIDDYFTQLMSPAELLPVLFAEAGAAGLSIDYLVREAACAVAAPGSCPAELVAARLVDDPPPGSTGARPAPRESGWVCNGVRSPQRDLNEAMSDEVRWQPPSENGANRHSVFLDVELWQELPDGRQYSCPFLSAVWQLSRLGALREHGRPLWTPESWDDEYPQTWNELPAVLAVNPDADPFTAYRTCSVLGTRFLPVEHAVRVILGQYMLAPAVAAQLTARAAGERLTLPEELVDRIGYAYVGGWR
jgi:hypothetical protein